MATYVIHNIPNELFQKLKDRAFMEDKSPRTLILELLEKGLKDD